MGIDALTVISTGVDPPAAAQRQWDDGGNALAIDRRVMLCYERNVETNARLEAAGVEVIGVPGSELGWARGGPRAMSCAVNRDSVAEAVQPQAAALAAAPAAALPLAAVPPAAAVPSVAAGPAAAPPPGVPLPAAATAPDVAANLARARLPGPGDR